MPYVNIDVDVDLTDFDTDELISELESRGHDYNTHGVDGDEARVLMEQVYQARRAGQPYEASLDKLIWYVLGRM
jgi:hypothetical protein